MATVVSVGGTSRSGTTLIHAILGNADDAFACGEVVDWYRPSKRHHFTLQCACGKTPCPVWERVQQVPQARFHAAALDEFGVNYLIDSSKDICWLIDTRRWLAREGIDAVNLFVWKNPIDLAYSFWKRGLGPTYWRSQFVRYYSKVFAVGLPLLTVNFNEFTQEPATKTAQICQAIGMPYFVGKEHFWTREHHHLFGSLGVRRQIEAADSVIQPKTTYAAEFQTLVDDLEKQIAADAQVQAIVATLRQADVSLAAAGHRANAPVVVRRPYPLWYYGKRLKQVIQRTMPRSYNPAASEKIATIPLRDQKLASHTSNDQKKASA